MKKPPNKSPNMLLKFLLAAAVMLVAMQGLDWIAAQLARSNHSYAQAPAVPTLDGAGFEALLTRNNKPTLVFIYASWCPYCRTQKPVIEQMQAQYANVLNVVAISIDKDPAGLARYLSHDPTTLEVYRVAGDKFLDFRVALAATGSKFTGAIPYSAYFSPQKKMLAEIPGYVDKATFERAYQFAIANP